MIKHDTWFEVTYQGKLYRAKYETYGYSYATFWLQEQVEKIRPKWVFFGEAIKYNKWVTVSYDTRRDYSSQTSVINGQKWYDVKQTKERIRELIEVVSKYNKTNHTKRLEI